MGTHASSEHDLFHQRLMTRIAMRAKSWMSAALLATIAWVSSAPSGAADTTKPYRVINGRVDDATYRGWRAFHSACHACHGVDAVGTAIAPNLVERVRDLSAKQFTIKVLTSYRIVMGQSEASGEDQTAIRERFAEEAMRSEAGELRMPAWGNDEGMRPRVTDLYAYLRARADGALGPGEPKRLGRPLKPTGDAR
jgi:mono/diheme cytochrome c family protein